MHHVNAYELRHTYYFVFRFKNLLSDCFDNLPSQSKEWFIPVCNGRDWAETLRWDLEKKDSSWIACWETFCDWTYTVVFKTIRRRRRDRGFARQFPRDWNREGRPSVEGVLVANILSVFTSIDYDNVIRRHWRNTIITVKTVW